MRRLMRLKRLIDVAKSKPFLRMHTVAEFVRCSRIAAARKLVEIANAVEDGRVFIERVNSAFLEAWRTRLHWAGCCDMRAEPT
jgi:hypothetical protein